MLLDCVTLKMTLMRILTPVFNLLSYMLTILNKSKFRIKVTYINLFYITVLFYLIL